MPAALSAADTYQQKCSAAPAPPPPCRVGGLAAHNAAHDDAMFHQAQNSYLVSHDRENVHKQLQRDASSDTDAPQPAACDGQLQNLHRPYACPLAVPAEPSPSVQMICRAIRTSVDGNALFRQGSYIAAIEKYSAALQVLRVCQPKDISGFGGCMEKAVVVTLLNRAACFLNAEGFNAALQDCSSLLQLADSSVLKTNTELHAAALFRRGLAYAKIFIFDDALTDLKAAQAILPADADLAKLVVETTAKAAAEAAADGFDWSRFEGPRTAGALSNLNAIPQGEVTVPAAAATMGLEVEKAGTYQGHVQTESLSSQLEGLAVSRAAFKRRELTKEAGERRIAEMHTKLKEAQDDLKQAEERGEDDEILTTLGWDVKTRMAKHKELVKRTIKPASERENDAPWYYGHLMEASSESDEDENENAGGVSNTQKDVRIAAAAAEKRRLKKRMQMHDTVHIPTEDDLAPRVDDDGMEETEPGSSQDAPTRLAACLDSFGTSAEGGEPDWQANYAAYKSAARSAQNAGQQLSQSVDIHDTDGEDESDDDEDMPPLENPDAPTTTKPPIHELDFPIVSTTEKRLVPTDSRPAVDETVELRLGGLPSGLKAPTALPSSLSNELDDDMIDEDSDDDQ